MHAVHDHEYDWCCFAFVQENEQCMWLIVFSWDHSDEALNREQLILSQLEHPNIVSFHHSGRTEDGTRYLVMEYIDEAHTITDYSQNHQLSTNAIMQLVYKLAKVFIYAHNNLIIHRDVKPTNILVDNQGTLKVIDFGIGQIISPQYLWVNKSRFL